MDVPSTNGLYPSELCNTMSWKHLFKVWFGCLLFTIYNNNMLFRRMHCPERKYLFRP